MVSPDKWTYLYTLGDLKPILMARPLEDTCIIIHVHVHVVHTQHKLGTVHKNENWFSPGFVARFLSAMQDIPSAGIILYNYYTILYIIIHVHDCM